MAKSKTFQCQLITPEAAVLDTQAISAVLTAHDGEFGVLYDRSPLLFKLGIGQLKLENDKDVEHYYIEGGFVQVLGNEMTILTQKAIAAKDIDATEAEKELSQARSLRVTNLNELELRTLAIKRSNTKLKLSLGR